MNKIKNIGSIFLIILLAGFLILSFTIFLPYLTPIIFALLFTIIFTPLNKFFLNKVKLPKNISAGLTTLLIALLILLPLTLLVFAISSESVKVYNIAKESFQSQKLADILDIENWDFLQNFITENFPGLQIDEIAIKDQLLSIIQSLSNYFIKIAGNIVKNLLKFIVYLIIMLFTMFFLLRDGEEFLKYLLHLSPLPTSHEIKITGLIKASVKGIFFGVFVTALIQGIVAGIGYAIVGLSPFFWGFVIFFFSMIPIVGAWGIWLPTALVLLFTGNIWQGIFLIIWGSIISSIDNVLRPVLMKDKTKMPSILIFFSILGGITFFGILGIIYGPLILSVTKILLDIYEFEYKTHLETMDNG